MRDQRVIVVSGSTVNIENEVVAAIAEIEQMTKKKWWVISVSMFVTSAMSNDGIPYNTVYETLVIESTSEQGIIPPQPHDQQRTNPSTPVQQQRQSSQPPQNQANGQGPAKASPDRPMSGPQLQYINDIATGMQLYSDAFTAYFLNFTGEDFSSASSQAASKFIEAHKEHAPRRQR